MIKGVLFDLDGTILESLDVWDSVAELFLNEQHIPIPKDLKQTLESLSFEQSAAYFIELGNLTMSIREVTTSFYEIVADQYSHSIQAKPFVKAYIEKLAKSNISMGVVTTTDKELCNSCLQRLGLLSYMTFILTCGEVEKGKDEPMIYIEGAKRLQCEQAEVVVIEDAPYAIETAITAGFQVYAIKDSHHNIPTTLRNKCRLIESFEELL